jgi:hypothetical protein
MIVQANSSNVRFRLTPNGIVARLLQLGETLVVKNPHTFHSQSSQWVEVLDLNQQSGFVWSDFLTVMPFADYTTLYTTALLNLRAQPSISAQIIKRYPRGTTLYTNQNIDGIIGNSEAWIAVYDQAINLTTAKNPPSKVGYVNAAFVSLSSPPPNLTPPTAPPAVSKPNNPPTGLSRKIFGVNFDKNHPLSRPAADQVKDVTYIRLKFNMSFNPDNGTYGNTNPSAEYQRIQNFLLPYKDHKIILILGHQMYGEGAGYYWPQMTASDWQRLIPIFARYAGEVAKLFAGSGIIHAYQIWNEQDTDPIHARAAVPVPPQHYGMMLAQATQAVKNADPRALVITGGHVSGPRAGSSYIRQALRSVPPQYLPDGIAVHPYGRGVVGNIFSNFGDLNEEIQSYYPVLNKPVWFTEWGVLDQQGNDALETKVSEYARGFMSICKNSNHENQQKVACAIWYAWADTMDNGYGFVRANGQLRTQLFDAVNNR